MASGKSLPWILVKQGVRWKCTRAGGRPIYLLILSIAFAIALSFLFAPAAEAGGEPLDRIADVSRLSQAQLHDWSTIWDFVNENFVDPGLRGVDWRTARKSVEKRIAAGLDNAAFTALVNETLSAFKDGHTRYTPPEQIRADAVFAEKGFTGVGMFLMRGEGEYAVVITVFPGGPAERAGIASHDRILAIDDRSPLDAAGNVDPYRIRGPTGSSVRLRIESPGGEPRDIFLVREPVSSELGLVVARLISPEQVGGRRLGYALLATINTIAVDHLRAEYARLSASAPLDGFILDLRANAGGSFEALASCTGLFYGGRTGTIRDRKSVV
jgi:carboxyl-terminal processing protease